MMIRLLLVITILGLISCGERPTSNSVKSGSSTALKPADAPDGITIERQTQPDTIKKSIRALAQGTIGKTNISITYHSPAVRGRIIWGGLVPYDQVWVTGAHMATTIRFDAELELMGKPVPAGQYALFTIPGKDTWTVIVNQNWQQHLTDEYDAALDVIRFEVKPIQETEPQERLRYAIIETEAGGVITMQWEKLKIEIPVSGQ